jgi:hypothetical protein
MEESTVPETVNQARGKYKAVCLWLGCTVLEIRLGNVVFVVIEWMNGLEDLGRLGSSLLRRAHPAKSPGSRDYRAASTRTRTGQKSLRLAFESVQPHLLRIPQPINALNITQHVHAGAYPPQLAEDWNQGIHAPNDVHGRHEGWNFYRCRSVRKQILRELGGRATT